MDGARSCVGGLRRGGRDPNAPAVSQHSNGGNAMMTRLLVASAVGLLLTAAMAPRPADALSVPQVQTGDATGLIQVRHGSGGGGFRGGGFRGGGGGIHSFHAPAIRSFRGPVVAPFGRRSGGPFYSGGYSGGHHGHHHHRGIRIYPGYYGYAPYYYSDYYDSYYGDELRMAEAQGRAHRQPLLVAALPTLRRRVLLRRRGPERSGPLRLRHFCGGAPRRLQAGSSDACH